MHLDDVALKLALDPETDLLRFGRDKAKVLPHVRDEPRIRKGPSRLVLVSAITPTPAGEGKTTTSIGLAQAMEKLGKCACLALREPSLGPVFGVKGGGTGGGASRLVPTADINLHFTGDLHAIGAAHNLLAAMVDNHCYFDLEPVLHPRRVSWKRVIDMNDRSLRNVVLGLGGPRQGVPREGGFDITAASEVMAMLCLAEDADDLRNRIDRTLIGFSRDNKPVTAGDVGATGAMMALLRDAMMPNLVQTVEGTPAIVHGGPFANIAHGCNSVIATKMALHLADWVVTEAGFGFDLGAEKFFDIKCRGAGLDTACVVLVATVRALKMHGGTKLTELTEPNAAAVEAGLPNLEKHVESIRHFTEPPVIALNRFHADTDEEIDVVRAWCARHNLPFAVTDHFARGGEGALELAHAVLNHAELKSSPFEPLYPLDAPILDKVRAVATKMYGAREVVLTKQAQISIKRIKRMGYAGLPICIAKTQSSLSDDPRLRGRPTDFEITVSDVIINAGAGFLVVLTGDILRMPGLPRRPQALDIDLVDGVIQNVK